ncbi:MAG: response regulator transcription factor [Candidatus Dormibacteraceae bacterium]
MDRDVVRVCPVRVLVVQNHPLLASAIATVLESQSDLVVCGIARRGDEAAKLAAMEKPSVVLMDFRLPDLSGPAAAANIRLAAPCVAIVFHSAEESEVSLLDAIDAGATGYLTKSATADQIIEAVRRAAVGEVLIPVALFAKAIARQLKMATDKKSREKLFAEFTPRELDVLGLLAEGHDTRTLSTALGIAPHTVEWHVRHVIEKLGVHSKLQAVIAAARLGLIEIAPEPGVDLLAGATHDMRTPATRFASEPS